MQPHDLIRAAAKLIETQGWAHGVWEEGNMKGSPIAARDVSGAPVNLLETATGGESRTRVNPAAHSLSIYGALVKAQAAARSSVANPGLLWDTLMQMSIEAGAPATGGTNYVHPVVGLNELEGQTKEDILAFMEQAASAIEFKLTATAANDAPVIP